MADIEKQRDPITPIGRDGNLRTPSDSDVDLEKADTIQQTPTSGLCFTDTRSRTNISRSRSAATDGYSAYHQDDDSDVDGSKTGVAIKSTKTRKDPFEVRWDGPDDKLSPRNFNITKKWVIVMITSAASFCV